MRTHVWLTMLRVLSNQIASGHCARTCGSKCTRFYPIKFRLANARARVAQNVPSFDQSNRVWPVRARMTHNVPSCIQSNRMWPMRTHLWLTMVLVLSLKSRSTHAQVRMALIVPGFTETNRVWPMRVHVRLINVPRFYLNQRAVWTHYDPIRFRLQQICCDHRYCPVSLGLCPIVCQLTSSFWSSESPDAWPVAMYHWLGWTAMLHKKEHYWKRVWNGKGCVS